MVEMKDIQVMTEKATPSSIVIIDELGRGTSTGEGMAIAQAVIEFVHHGIGCKALVSTHFHELAHLEDSLPSLANACMAVQESGDKVTFLRKLIPGAASTSYGIYCAQLAGLPENIISRAYELLQAAGNAPEQVQLSVGKPPDALTPGKADVQPPERSGQPVSTAMAEPVSPDGNPLHYNEAAVSAEDVVQLSIFEPPARQEPARPRKTAKAEQLADQLKRLDLFNLTPMQAMQWLNDMKQKLSE